MKKFSFPAAAVRRYLRLGVPMVTAVILAWSLVMLLPDASSTTGALNGNAWLAGYLRGRDTGASQYDF
ncbi:hypothetical protein [Mesorhizobium sp. M1403]|uniref:hypothetical protein n=1 Tax=Mesorhizobium sp. M1403 TaxID=2957097 RepID=UPI003338BF5A